MISRLLTDLFGADRHSSQYALATLTPELLASVGEVEPTPRAGEAASPAPIDRALPGPSWRSRRALGLATGLAAVGALAIGLWARSARDRLEPSPRSGTAPAVPTVAASPPAPMPVSAPAPAFEAPPPSPPSVRAAPEAPARPRHPVLARRAAAPRVSSDENRIASGLSIDPFAEAAKRGHR